MSSAPSKRESATSPTALFGRLLGYARRYAPLIALGLLFGLVLATGRYGRAYLIKPLIDEVVVPRQHAEAPAPPASGGLLDWLPLAAIGPETDAPRGPERDAALAARARFAEILLIALGITVAVPLAIFGRMWCLRYAIGRVNVDLRQELVEKLMRLPLSFHRRARSGDTLTRVMVDVDQNQKAFELLFLDLGQAVLMVAIGATTALLISWQLALITLVVAPPLVAIVGTLGGKVRRGSRRRQQQLGEITGRLVGILSGIKVIKAFRGEAAESAAFLEQNRKYFRRTMRVVQQRALSRSLTEFLNSGAGIGVLVLGVLLVIQGRWDLTLGDVSALSAVIATTYRPVKELSRGWGQLMESAASAERFFALLDAPDDPADPPGAVQIDGLRESIRFDRVSFSYGREPVLHDVTLEIRPGEVVAVVGPTGSGKTTLVDLLLRFHDPDEGSIRIDGVDLRDIARNSLHDQLALVTQEPFLFDATIRENVLYGRPDASEAALRAACSAAHVDEFVAKLPLGYDTPVGEFGAKLSGGQRQRITIARAILKQAAVLVFDEATSALDARTERALQEALDALRGKRTVFVIAHRLSTIRRADRILVLDRGRVRQQGSHEELLAESGLYRELAVLSDQWIRDDSASS